MRYTYFEIENFKGVEHARLDMNKTLADVFTQ